MFHLLALHSAPSPQAKDLNFDDLQLWLIVQQQFVVLVTDLYLAEGHFGIPADFAVGVKCVACSWQRPHFDAPDLFAAEFVIEDPPTALIW